jgi:basic membrane protein A and related proteins
MVIWSLLLTLGLFMILSALTGVNVALTQTTPRADASAPPDTTVIVAAPLATKRVIGLRLGAGGWSEPYNNALWQGVTNALRETPSAPFEVVLYDKTSPLSVDVDLLLTAGPDQSKLRADAKTYPTTQFVVLDNGNNRTGNTPNLHDITFEESQASYLLGYLAGTLSQTGVVGFVSGTKTEGTLANEAAFAQGLLAACSACQLHSEVVGRSNDIVLGAAAAQALIHKGADILFADAGDAGQGVISYINDTMCASAVKTRPSPLTGALTMVAKNINYLSRCAGSYPLFFIGNGRYQPSSGDNDNDPTSLNHGLTSLAKYMDVAVYKTIQSFLSGKALQTRHLSLQDDAVGVAVDEYNRALLPKEVLAQLDTIKAQLISGKIVLNTSPTP